MRHCELAIISDCHLGTPHCRDAELHDYLHDIRPSRLIINGDLCDLGPYFTKHWPHRHQAILQRILALSCGGCEVIYVIGNHDAAMHRFADILPGITCCREYRFAFHGRRWLITHGHRFDGQLCALPLVRRLGGLGYECLQGLEGLLNRGLQFLRLPQCSLVSTIKHHIPGARSVIRRFQEAAIDLAFSEAADVICCGHIHVPKAEQVCRDQRQVTYLNSGDWVEHCSAIEADATTITLHSHQLATVEALPERCCPDFGPGAVDAA